MNYELIIIILKDKHYLQKMSQKNLEFLFANQNSKPKSQIVQN
jgi:hypothetical protein